MKTKSKRQPIHDRAPAQLSGKIVEPEKLTKKYRRQTKHDPPEFRLVNRFRESHREPGTNR